ncbi:MAG: hemolysin family protein [Muribaculaceae bacterium]|nr:hemolysin family protein [Muribaculaceae bacterium]
MNDIVVIIILILLNGVFSMSEIALISARRERLHSEALKGSRSASNALRLADDPDRFLSTIQIGITLIGILTGLFSGAALADDVGIILERLGLQAKTAHAAGQTAIVVIVTYLSIVFGELVPKRIGLAAATGAAKIVAGPMRLLSIVALPAVWLLSASTRLIVRIIGLRNHENTITDEEIRAIIRQGAESGKLCPIEQDIMERTLLLGDRHVSYVMTPARHVASMTPSMTSAEVRAILAVEPHEVYPVYCREKGAKRVCGIVSLKELILAIDKPDFKLDSVAKDALCVPENMNVYQALARMRSAGAHLAIVCDEYGDMKGILTPADILENLLGPDNMFGYISHCENTDSWSADARMPFYDFLRFFGLTNLYGPTHYTSLGGFLLDAMRRVPSPGESYSWGNFIFTVESADGPKIKRINIKRLTAASRTT